MSLWNENGHGPAPEYFCRYASTCGPLAVLLRLNLQIGSVVTQEDGHFWSNWLNLCYLRGCSQPSSEMLLKHSKTNPRMTCGAPTQSCFWPCTPASSGCNLGFRPISSGHQGFCNTRERRLALHSLFLAVWCEMLLKSVDLHCYKTRYIRAGKYLDISI